MIDLQSCILGACCIDGICLDLTTESNCLSLGGTFFGVGSTCAQSPACRPACPGDISGEGIVNVTDLLALLAAWGACP
ncbi:MAG: hypothetical protein IID30_04790 [Planctomycetes bacterium]|nr:hypothetical protein [Planctomycetota bacterium]